MKNRTKLFVQYVLLICLLFPKMLNAQNIKCRTDSAKNYWNVNLQIDGLRLALPPSDYKPEYLDLNNDGKPDAIKSMTKDNIPILWLDDDGNLKPDDLEGDMVNDCLLIDTNKDGKYERVIKYADFDDDGKADMQMWAEYPDGDTTYKETPHFMVVFDTDKDGVFNYINWNRSRIESWKRTGISDFLCDYEGNSTFLKTHTSSDKMRDLRFNWENPFYFYDCDGDGLTEISMRLADKMEAFAKDDTGGTCNQMDFSIDIDNSNSHAGKAFAYDMSLRFIGKGYNYNKEKYHFQVKNMRGLPEADRFFIDPRIRQIKEFIFPNREDIWKLTFKTGEWSKVYFSFDEDNDGGKWERQDYCYPNEEENAFKLIGIDEWGADVAGDRNEWDLNNSGDGKLYISRFDGRIHLYGAEWGVWRIDQYSEYYQRSHNKWLNIRPDKVATVKYTDTDDNGFIDLIEYDLDGDEKFETTVSLKALGIDDTCDVIDITNYTYKDYDKYQTIFQKSAENILANALTANKVALKYNIGTNWYSRYKSAYSLREKYENGYWFQFYVYNDLLDKFIRDKNAEMIKNITIAYYTANWKSLL